MGAPPTSAKCCFIALFQLGLFAAWIIAKLTTRCTAVECISDYMQHKNIIHSFLRILTVASLYIQKSERATNNCCSCVSEIMITNCSPDVIVIHFKTSFIWSWTWSSDQSHCKQHV